jgi:hypothetical protein
MAQQKCLGHHQSLHSHLGLMPPPCASGHHGAVGLSVTLVHKPRHDRLCWLIQKHPEKRSCIRRLKARETEYIPLLKLTYMALEIDRRDLTNRVTTSFTSEGVQKVD